MKTISILLILVSIIVLLILVLLYFFGFIMSFDAPGSDKDPSAWMMRFLIFLPVLILGIILILAIIAYAGQHYQRAFWFGAVTPIAGAALFSYMLITSLLSTREFHAQLAKEAEEAALYPKQIYTRTRDIGTDTIIVFPNRIVSYRLHVGNPHPWGGPLGDLSEDRKVLLYDTRPDTRLPKEEIAQFVDEKGRPFTEVYIVK